MYNFNNNVMQSYQVPKEKKENAFAANYEYSLAIEKCNKRLERLKNERNYLMKLKQQVPIYDPRAMMPMRQPVNPNPMLYAYQFIPPKMYDQARMPQMTYPIMHNENTTQGMRIPQSSTRTMATGFNYEDLTQLVNSLKNGSK